MAVEFSPLCPGSWPDLRLSRHAPRSELLRPWTLDRAQPEFSEDALNLGLGAGEVSPGGLFWQSLHTK
jgi:hypothetical protein